VEAVHVLHAFHKKTRATPRKDLEMVKGQSRQLLAGRISVWPSTGEHCRERSESPAGWKGRSRLMGTTSSLLTVGDYTAKWIAREVDERN
jgi:hypothetical protein